VHARTLTSVCKSGIVLVLLAMFSLGYSPTYVIGLSQCALILTHLPLTHAWYSVPQGSVLGPLLFSIYISPISTIAESHHVSQQQHADDTQLYIALLPANYNQDITALESYVSELSSHLVL